MTVRFSVYTQCNSGKDGRFSLYDSLSVQWPRLNGYATVLEQCVDVHIAVHGVCSGMCMLLIIVSVGENRKKNVEKRAPRPTITSMN